MFPRVPVQRVNSWIPTLNAVMRQYNINNFNRITMFMAQTGHETDNYNTFVEYTNADGTNPWCIHYDGGCRFRGRGALQLTGRANYRAAGRALNQNFEANPDLVAQMPWAFQTAGWFWASRNLNAAADRGDLEGATRVINGGLNGLANRRNLLNVARRCMS
jgi:predicted chitinase